MKLAKVLVWVFCLKTVNGDFFYKDFKSIMGLVLNGNAATSTCTSIPENAYASTYATADDPTASVLEIQSQMHDVVSVESISTTDFQAAKHITATQASFKHRNTYRAAPDEQCSARLRLTPSRPDQRSSIWYNDPVPILHGFESSFTFQISDHSKRCYHIKDQDFGIRHHESCVVHGGDGFAFVLHMDPNKTKALGDTGGGLGYSGIKNSIAIEFDTWENADPADTYWDHISVHSNGIQPNNPQEHTRLALPIKHDLADGSVHTVKIAYYDSIQYQHLQAFSASENVLKYLVDISEGRRLGTLLVFIDDGIGKNEPCVAIPINLAATLRLEQDLAYVGFTSSTGRSWEKHDILDWAYCTSPPCLQTKFGIAGFEIDYHKTTAQNAKATHTMNDPKHVFTDTTPWAAKQTHFSAKRTSGLGDAYSHIPHVANTQTKDKDGA